MSRIGSWFRRNRTGQHVLWDTWGTYPFLMMSMGEHGEPGVTADEPYVPGFRPDDPLWLRPVLRRFSSYFRAHFAGSEDDTGAVAGSAALADPFVQAIPDNTLGTWTKVLELNVDGGGGWSLVAAAATVAVDADGRANAVKLRIVADGTPSAEVTVDPANDTATVAFTFGPQRVRLPDGIRHSIRLELLASGLAKTTTISAASITVTDAGSQSRGTVGGDLTGSLPNPTVAGLRGRPVAAAAPSIGDVYIWDGSQFVPGAISADPSAIRASELATRWVPVTTASGELVTTATGAVVLVEEPN